MTLPARVIFIDDEELLVSIARQILEGSGFSVLASTSAIQALESFKAQPNDFDVIVCDQMMPQMRGDALLAQVRSLRQDIPVILCSGIIQDENVAAHDPAVFFLSKPFSWDELCEKIADLIKQGRSA